MKAIIISEPGGPEVLQMAERPRPSVLPGEVLVKVYASGVNRPDVYQRKGNYPPPKGTSADIPGLEIAGIVAATGAEVTRWHVGDKICALVMGGGYAEYCSVPAAQCLPVPAGLSFEEAASLPETFFTVWSNVFDRGRLKDDETLLVHGGSSGIGVAAIQMAKALGHTVYVTAGSDEKCRFCEMLGAARAINYKTENFAAVTSQLTGGKGVDVILDMIGGDYTAGNLASLANEGRLVLINTMNGKDAQVDLSVVMRKRLTITGSMLRARETAFKAGIAHSLEKAIWPLIEAGRIKPVISKIFPAEQAAEAHRLMESSAHTGKIILKWDVGSLFTFQ
ncbi:NAD(P)H-quinone oxidoreductase [Mucilaginibacter xinganensis]|uniref:Zinc-binding dehydrogenase n=1 Tax=Mucilaginibacter xinganensis TaxID=1234841 RepID=A0A223P3U1_9SPHI|nr:NAD(P)H-quinone oxidoreductase [Mucilaginibacter xinganensis]ASU36765.1 zinc-binding dehydrogenase [Mucilaginibacter xinganensis]